MDRRELLPSGPGWPLTEPEKRLIECAERGERWKPQSAEDQELDLDPSHADGWSDLRIIRAEVLRCLATGVPWSNETKVWLVHNRGIEVEGARIHGSIDFTGCEIVAGIQLEKCAIAEKIDFTDAKARFVSFAGSHVREISGDRAIIQSSLHLRDGFCATGQVRLVGARIEGSLDCSGGKFENKEAAALQCSNVQVKTYLSLDCNFQAIGMVDLHSATVGGVFCCAGGKFENRDGVALDGSGMVVGGDVVLGTNARVSFRAFGKIKFEGAKIGGDLDCTGARFKNPNGFAFSGHRMAIGGDAVFRSAQNAKPFGAVGVVDLSGSQIGGHLNCHGGRFMNREKVALNCADVAVGENVHLSNSEDGTSFVSIGEIRLSRATIEGQVACPSGSFLNSKQVALRGDMMRVTGSVTFGGGHDNVSFRAVGEISVVEARIGGQFACTGGRFENYGGLAISASQLTVGSSVFLVSLEAADDPLYAIGEVSFTQATIGGVFDCSGGTFQNPNGTSLSCEGISANAVTLSSRGGKSFHAQGTVSFLRARVRGDLTCYDGHFVSPGDFALNLASARVGGRLSLHNMAEFSGILNLEHVYARILCDNSTVRQVPVDDGTFTGYIVLDGLVYERLETSGVGSAKERKSRGKPRLIARCLNHIRGHEDEDAWCRWLQWLRCQPPWCLNEEFRPQPWEQLIKVLRDMGYDYGARRVAIEREKAIAKSALTSWYRKTWYWFVGVTVGYGYRPELTLAWSAAFWMLGAIVFGTAAQYGYIAPRDGQVLLDVREKGELISDYPRFNSVVYAADAYLPVIELGQDGAWTLSNVKNCQVRQTGSCTQHGNFLIEDFFLHGGHRLVYWALDILGWIFVSLYVAGMSGLMKRD